MKPFFFVCILSSFMFYPALGCSQGERPGDSATEQLTLPNISLPRGFHISFYADNVPNARSMALSPSGILYVGTRSGGNVFALVDSNKDNHVDRVFTIASGMNMPNGVAFRDGSLYVAEVNRVVRFDKIEQHLARPPKPVVVNDSFPSETSHGWKFIRIGPDGKLYVPVGAPCNVCRSDDRRYASIMRMNLDGSQLEVYAEGVRNTVGFDWQPGTSELWFTDNGRDNLGDDIPPDELNRAPRSGLHFGFPFVHGKTIPDPEFKKEASDQAPISPAMELGPHVAALGMRFYTGTMFPAE